MRYLFKVTRFASSSKVEDTDTVSQLEGVPLNVPEPWHSLYIFVVDDELVIASTLAAILQLEGFKVAYFVNPLTALKSALHESPDLLISDVSMPQLSGVELAIRFRSAVPACRILLFSGESESGRLRESTNESQYEFDLLAKPIHPKTLVAKIRILKALPTTEHSDWFGSTSPKVNQEFQALTKRLSAHT